MGVLKVKPWSKDQGDFVLIEDSDFDDSTHELYESVEEKKKPGRPKKTDE